MISVCIATYNGAPHIGEQLASILPQLHEGDEVVISDDGSTDDTLSIVASFRSPLVKVVQGPCKGSPILNFENALRHCSGDYVFLADQDDKWTGDKVERMTEALQTADCVVSDCYVTDEHLRVTDDSFYRLNRTRPGTWYNLLQRNGYLGCCMAFSRRAVEKSLPFPKDIPMHDIWMGNVSAFWFNVKFIDDKLIYFRRHGHNASVTATRSPYSLKRKIGFRWHVLRQLLRRFSGRRHIIIPPVSR